MRLRLLVTAVLLTSFARAADPGLLNVVMPGAQALAGVNVQQVLASPFGQYLLTQNPQPDPGLYTLAQATGFDFRHDLQEILTASNGQPGGAWILGARGTFDAARITEASLANGATVETCNGVQVIQWAVGKGQPSVAFPEDTLAIVGSTAEVCAAILRKSGPAVLSPGIASAVNDLSAANDAWFVSIAPLAKLEAQTAGPFALFKTLVQLSGGVKFGADVAVNLNGVCQTAPQAAALVEGLKALLAAAAANGQAAGPAKLILQNLNLSASGDVITLALTIPEQQIESLIKPGKFGPAGVTPR
jgi:hypothetical protein